MNKSFKRMIALFSTSLISVSALLSTFSSAAYDLYPGSNRNVYILPKQTVAYDYAKKETSSSIWIGYSSAPVYISVYGTNSGRTYDLHDITNCEYYWESLNMYNLYLDQRNCYTIRNYVYENNYNYAALVASPVTVNDRDGVGFGWQADVNFDTTVNGYLN